MSLKYPNFWYSAYSFAAHTKWTVKYQVSAFGILKEEFIYAKSGALDVDHYGLKVYEKCTLSNWFDQRGTVYGEETT